jgi:GNAT superfamily N-acetyltransferase
MEHDRFPTPPEYIRVRHAEVTDHPYIISVLKPWWGGRDLTAMVPRLFLEHFSPSSFVVEDRDKRDRIAFLIGFLSPAHSNQGYIHFAGVHPGHRRVGIGAFLYQRFFMLCRQNDRFVVRSCTSPVNTGSILFHRKMGFAVLPGNGEIDETPVMLDYNKPGDHKVRFEKRL